MPQVGNLKGNNKLKTVDLSPLSSVAVGQDKRTLIGLNAAVFFMMLGVGMIMAQLPQRILDLTGDGAQVGYLASAFALSYIALQVPIGNLADRYGFKLFLLLGYFICTLTGALYFVADTANLIFLGRMLQGVGEAPVWALAPALLSIRYPLARAKVMGFYNASLHLGLTLGPILGVLLRDILTGNQMFLSYAVVCLLGAVIILVGVENPGRSRAPQGLELKQIAALARHRETGVVLMAIALYGVGYGAFLTNIPAFLLEVRRFDTTQIGVFFALFYLAVSISQVVTGPLSDRFGRKLFMVIGLFLSGAAVFLFSYFATIAAIVLLTIASLGLGILCLSSMAYLNETVSDTLKGTVSGAFYLFWGIGFFFGPMVLGRLGALPGHKSGFILLALLLAGNGALLASVRQRQLVVHDAK